MKINAPREPKIGDFIWVKTKLGWFDVVISTLENISVETYGFDWHFTFDTRFNVKHEFVETCNPKVKELRRAAEILLQEAARLEKGSD